MVDHRQTGRDCHKCGPEGNQLMRLVAAHGRADDACVSVYQCTRCGRLRSTLDTGPQVSVPPAARLLPQVPRPRRIAS